VDGVGFLRNLLPTNEELSQDPGGSDAELVAQAKRGNSQAFALLYRRYLDQVYDFAANRLESREAAEDATQTIFMRAVASLPQCRDDAMLPDGSSPSPAMW
jgi:Sigma-70 region 2